MVFPALCCLQALRDATARWPNRDRASDGIMGDTAHQKRHSDHNDGNAFDPTHDPAHGVDCGALSRLVINDNRVTYVISNRQIYNRARVAEGWRPYIGLNPHNRHMHVSIRAASRDDLSPWPWSASAANRPFTSKQPILGGTPRLIRARLYVKEARVLTYGPYNHDSRTLDMLSRSMVFSGPAHARQWLLFSEKRTCWPMASLGQKHRQICGPDNMSG